MNIKKILIAIITNLSKNEEYCETWRLPGKGSWIFDSNGPIIQEFEELNKIYKPNITWDEFDRENMTLPATEEITALVLDGANTKPHQLEIIRNLLLKEECQIDFLLIHVAGNAHVGTIPRPNIFLSSDIKKTIIFPKKGDPKIHFKKERGESSIPAFNYSLGGSSNIFLDWLKVISKAVGEGNLSCAVERLNELYKLLKKYKHNEYDKQIIESNPPGDYYSHAIASQIVRLFLDLKIDLKGLSELRQEAEGAPAEEQKAIMDEIKHYLSKIPFDKEDAYFRQKLADARFLAFGKTYGKGMLDCGKKSGSVPIQESSLVRDLFEGTNLKEVLETNPCKNEKVKLAESLGLKIVGRGLSIDLKHSILPFLIHLDCFCNKATEQMDDAEIAGILNLYPLFCDWYDQLIENIDSLKKTIR